MKHILLMSYPDHHQKGLTKNYLKQLEKVKEEFFAKFPFRKLTTFNVIHDYEGKKIANSFSYEIISNKNISLAFKEENFNKFFSRNPLALTKEEFLVYLEKGTDVVTLIFLKAEDMVVLNKLIIDLFSLNYYSFMVDNGWATLLSIKEDFKRIHVQVLNKNLSEDLPPHLIQKHTQI